MKNIAKRDVKIFLLGMFAMIVIEVVYDWAEHVQDFKEGFKAGFSGEVNK